MIILRKSQDSAGACPTNRMKRKAAVPSGPGAAPAVIGVERLQPDVAEHMGVELLELSAGAFASSGQLHKRDEVMGCFDAAFHDGPRHPPGLSVDRTAHRTRKVRHGMPPSTSAARMTGSGSGQEGKALSPVILASNDAPFPSGL